MIIFKLELKQYNYWEKTDFVIRFVFAFVFVFVSAFSFFSFCGFFFFFVLFFLFCFFFFFLEGGKLRSYEIIQEAL